MLAIDAGVMSQIITEVFKVSAGRDRPREGTGSNSWVQHYQLGKF